ncbi:MAG: hypothetical protein U1D31_01020 [Patescibacteria group bacterium]|nr:hypothetical protein [bacterium]MDZ4240701.1 hypothetical protein [Patescibacteria group bacterium]
MLATKAIEREVFQKGDPITILFAGTVRLKGVVKEDLGKKVRVTLHTPILIREKVVFQSGILGVSYSYEAPLKEDFTREVEVSPDCINV